MAEFKIKRITPLGGSSPNRTVLQMSDGRCQGRDGWEGDAYWQMWKELARLRDRVLELERERDDVQGMARDLRESLRNAQETPEYMTRERISEWARRLVRDILDMAEALNAAESRVEALEGALRVERHLREAEVKAKALADCFDKIGHAPCGCEFVWDRSKDFGHPDRIEKRCQEAVLTPASPKEG